MEIRALGHVAACHRVEITGDSGGGVIHTSGRMAFSSHPFPGRLASARRGRDLYNLFGPQPAIEELVPAKERFMSLGGVLLVGL